MKLVGDVALLQVRHASRFDKKSSCGDQRDQPDGPASCDDGMSHGKERGPMALTLRQRNELLRHLNRGMTPSAIADMLGRINDLEDHEVVMIRSAAHALANS